MGGSKKSKTKKNKQSENLIEEISDAIGGVIMDENITFVLHTMREVLTSEKFTSAGNVIGTIPGLGVALTLIGHAIESFRGSPRLLEALVSANTTLIQYKRKLTYLSSICSLIPVKIYNRYMTPDLIDLYDKLLESLSAIIIYCAALREDVQSNNFWSKLGYIFTGDGMLNSINQQMSVISGLFLAYYIKQTDIINKLMKIGHIIDGKRYRLTSKRVYMSEDANVYFYTSRSHEDEAVILKMQRDILAVISKPDIQKNIVVGVATVLTENIQNEINEEKQIKKDAAKLNIVRDAAEKMIVTTGSRRSTSKKLPKKMATKRLPQ